MKVLFHLGAVAALLGAGGLLVSTAQVMFGYCPPTYEWPAGWSDGTAMLSDDRWVVVVRGGDRAQIYDANWGFVRGWNVGARGQLFGLAVEPEDVVLIQTSRSQLRYTVEGELLSTTPLDDETRRLSRPLKGWIPDAPWTWILVNPVTCFLLLLGGFFLRMAAEPR